MIRRYLSRSLLHAAILFAALPSVAQVCDSAKQDYEPVSPSADFPAPKDLLAKWLGFNPDPDPGTGEASDHSKWQAMDIPRLRRHAWMLWAGLTADSKLPRPVDAGEPAAGLLPKWETWYRAEDVLQESAGHLNTEKGNPPTSVPQLLLAFPRELVNLKFASARSGPGLAPRRDNTQVVAGVLYNRPTCEHVIAKRLGDPVAKDNMLRNGLREIPAFPDRDSMALKTVWMYVPHDGCEIVPVWDGIPNEPKATHYQPAEWPRSIVVKTSSTRACAATGPAVDLNDFYWRELLSQLEVARIKDSFPSARVGDYMILVGMHVITKEIPNWVWATFWWHDHPDYGQFADGRPSQLAAAWRHYLMDVAYDMDRPWQSTAQPKATFNPYLEAAFEGGTRSNCMTCHRRSVWPLPAARETLDSQGELLQPGQIVVTGSEASEATYLPEFRKSLKLSFLWTLTRVPQK
jgi:hypothetical protein